MNTVPVLTPSHPAAATGPSPGLLSGEPGAVPSGPVMSVVMVDRPEALLEHVPAWERLAVSALEPNVFYEPWMFLPALRAFGPGTDFRIALVFASDPSCPRVAPLLCAVLPVQRQRC